MDLELCNLQNLSRSVAEIKYHIVIIIYIRMLVRRSTSSRWKSSFEPRSDRNGGRLNSFQNKLLFKLVRSMGLYEILWEKEKLLVTSNFSFSHGVFYHFGVHSNIFINFKLSSANYLKVSNLIVVYLIVVYCG